jgi:hypothetical protein
MARLADDVGYVHIMNERGSEPVAFGPGDDVPEWAARKMGAHVFPDGKHPYPDEATAESEREPGAIPPKGGAGSGRDAWAAYANDVEVDIAAGATRDEIIAAIEKAGKPTEYQD